MSGNSALGKSVLQDWYDAAASYPTNFNMPFSDLVDYLQSLSQNTFLDNFGDAAFYASQNVGIEAVRQSMRDLAAASQGLVSTFPDGTPRSSYWMDSLVSVSQASLTNLAFVKKIAPEVIEGTAKTVAGLAVGGVALYILAAGLAVGLAIYLSSASARRAAP
jgi:hypothetical protein